MFMCRASWNRNRRLKLAIRHTHESQGICAGRFNMFMRGAGWHDRSGPWRWIGGTRIGHGIDVRHRHMLAVGASWRLSRQCLYRLPILIDRISWFAYEREGIAANGFRKFIGGTNGDACGFCGGGQAVPQSEQNRTYRQSGI
jgi:hypothetical protein